MTVEEICFSRGGFNIQEKYNEFFYFMKLDDEEILVRNA